MSNSPGRIHLERTISRTETSGHQIMEMDEHKINPGHAGIRSVLRVAGPAVLFCGVIFIGIGLVSFFSAFGTFESPRYFWCCFVGIPLLFVGAVLTKVAFFGAVARYLAAETAPVGKDTFNYMARETQSGVRDIASAIQSGLTGDGRPCKRCDTNHDVDAEFCDQCGASLTATIHCPACSMENDSDAFFCDKCGTNLQSKDRTD